MDHDRLKNAALPHALSNVVSDLADLLQKEVRLARAEVLTKVATKLHAGLWMSLAGVLGFIAGILIAQAAVFAVASFGIALHWSCLIVAAIVAALALILYAKGRADAHEELTPARSIHQLKRDIATAKEQLT
jgi:hypothetical protein